MAVCPPQALLTGAGGTLVNGTYVLFDREYYGVSGACSVGRLSETLVITDGCMQVAAHLYDSPLADGKPSEASYSSALNVQGSYANLTTECMSASASSIAPSDTEIRTYSVSGNEISFFVHDTRAGVAFPDYAEFFVMQP